MTGTMHCKILYSFFIGLFLIITGCSDELVTKQSHNQDKASDGLSLEFIININNEASTRTLVNEKRSFSTGDIIHVQATFSLLSNGIEDQVIQYGGLQFDGKNWNPISTFQWPFNAKSGTFVAYFIPGSTGELQVASDGVIPFTQKLSEIETNNDPLTATAENVSYGAAIRLNFYHICSYLTIYDLEPGVASQFMFVSSSYAPEEGTPSVGLNNAYTISRNSDNILSFEFIKQEDPFYNACYIASHFGDVSIEGQTKKGVNYFLEPGYYESFKLLYPQSATSTYTYMTYSYNDIPTTGTQNVKPVLIRGNSYILSVTQSKGIEMNSPDEEERWDESEEYYNVDVEAFLKAVYNGKDYFNEEGTQILESTTNGTRLLYNIDFHNAYYTVFKDNTAQYGYFSPDVGIGEGKVFDGGFHYIRNLGSPLFRNNSGTIRNLGINEVDTKITLISEKSGEKDKDLDNLLDNSRIGIICDWNVKSGIINNIKVKGDVSINVKISEKGNGEAHNIGGLIGSNLGNVEDIAINSDSFSLTFENNNENPLNATISLGGITGQNAGTISNITYSGQSFRVVNKATGDLRGYYVGGGIGSANGSVSGIFLKNITVDCSGSFGNTFYTGGLAGRLSTESLEGAVAGSVMACSISGSVTGGKIEIEGGDIAPSSYTGGIVGGLYNVTLMQCNSVCEVTSPSDNINSIGTYGTGGAIGRIFSTLGSTIQDIIAYGNTLSGPQKFIGNFAGIVPPDPWWEENSSNNIDVKDFGIGNIGASM